MERQIASWGVPLGYTDFEQRRIDPHNRKKTCNSHCSYKVTIKLQTWWPDVPYYSAYPTMYTSQIDQMVGSTFELSTFTHFLTSLHYQWSQYSTEMLWAILSTVSLWRLRMTWTSTGYFHDTWIVSFLHTTSIKRVNTSSLSHIKYTTHSHFELTECEDVYCQSITTLMHVLVHV